MAQTEESGRTSSLWFPSALPKPLTFLDTSLPLCRQYSFLLSTDSSLQHSPQIFHLIPWSKDLVYYLLEKVPDVPQPSEPCYPIQCTSRGPPASPSLFILCSLSQPSESGISPPIAIPCPLAFFHCTNIY